MNITDCVQQIRDGLIISVEGQMVEPTDLRIKDNWGVGYQFACPYCYYNQKRPSKKKEKCARVYPLTGCYTYQFRCKRCKRKMSIHQFLQEQFPYVYEKYTREKKVAQQMKGARPPFKEK